MCLTCTRELLGTKYVSLCLYVCMYLGIQQYASCPSAVRSGFLWRVVRDMMTAITTHVVLRMMSMSMLMEGGYR